MKIEITSPPTTPEPEITYPCLMEARETGNIYMFLSAMEGVSLKHTPHGAGYYSTTLVEITDQTFWKPFAGQITLNNN